MGGCCGADGQQASRLTRGNCDSCPSFVTVSLVSSQLFVVIAIVLLGVLFKSTSAVAVCTTLYLILATSLTVLVKWAANNFWLPRSWQTCLKVRHASHLLCHNMQHSTAVRAFVCLCLCG